MDPVFVAGGTGYIGRPLIAALLDRGFPVHALVRPGSESKLPDRAVRVLGDALDPSTFLSGVPPNATFVHLVGTPHPNPTKAAEFRRVDFGSIRASIAAGQQSGARHLVYVSVAHPAPVMRAYIAVRREGESLVQASGIPATVVRPWYILGPGHWWPIMLVPVYAVLRHLPATRDAAERLGLVTRRAMVASLMRAIETPPERGVRIVEVPEIRRGRR